MEVSWGFGDWNLPGILSDYFPTGGKIGRAVGGIVTYDRLSFP